MSLDVGSVGLEASTSHRARNSASEEKPCAENTRNYKPSAELVTDVTPPLRDFSPGDRVHQGSRAFSMIMKFRREMKWSHLN